MENIKAMSDQERNIFFMQRFQQYKSNGEYNKINCYLQYPSGCTSCGWSMNYTSIWGVCIDQVLYTYYTETWIELSVSKLQHRVADWKNIYTV